MTLPPAGGSSPFKAGLHSPFKALTRAADDPSAFEEIVEESLLWARGYLHVEWRLVADDSLVHEAEATTDIKFQHIGRWRQLARFLDGYQIGRLQLWPISVAGFGSTSYGDTFTSHAGWSFGDEESYLEAPIIPAGGTLDVSVSGDVVTLTVEDIRADPLDPDPDPYQVQHQAPGYALVSADWTDYPSFGGEGEGLLGTFVFDDEDPGGIFPVHAYAIMRLEIDLEIP